MHRTKVACLHLAVFCGDGSGGVLPLGRQEVVIVGRDFRVVAAAAEVEALECKYYFQGSRGCLSSALSSSANITPTAPWDYLPRANPLSLLLPPELDNNKNRNLEPTSTATERRRPLKVTLTPPRRAPSPPTMPSIPPPARTGCTPPHYQRWQQLVHRCGGALGRLLGSPVLLHHLGNTMHRLRLPRRGGSPPTIAINAAVGVIIFVPPPERPPRHPRRVR